MAGPPVYNGITNVPDCSAVTWYYNCGVPIHRCSVVIVSLDSTISYSYIIKYSVTVTSGVANKNI